ncbi:MAG: hypothetical protein R3Y43_03980 [Alphaproteobacteria bacterium]
MKKPIKKFLSRNLVLTLLWLSIITALTIFYLARDNYTPLGLLGYIIVSAISSISLISKRRKKREEISETRIGGSTIIDYITISNFSYINKKALIASTTMLASGILIYYNLPVWSAITACTSIIVSITTRVFNN